jgi:hypothetical protein
MSNYIKIGPDHSIINYSLAILRVNVSDLTGNLNITQYHVYYDAINVSTSKLFGSIIDPNITSMSQMYLNSAILNIFEDQYFRIKTFNLLGEGPLSNYAIVKRY